MPPKKIRSPSISSTPHPRAKRFSSRDYPETPDQFNPADALVAEDAPGVLQPSRLAWRDAARGLFLYHGDCLEVMDTIAHKHPGGVFDLIFADPPYFLSNGGIK